MVFLVVRVSYRTTPTGQSQLTSPVDFRVHAFLDAKPVRSTAEPQR